MDRREHLEKARECLLGHEDDASALRVMPEDGAGATPLFTVTLDIGWAESIIATGMYEKVAFGVAHALACVLDCKVEALFPAERPAVRVSPETHE